MRSGVIVLAPPWPRSGSGNIFAAQVAAHARRGARVLLLLTPTGRGFAQHKTHIWRDAVAAMRYPGAEAVVYPRAGRGQLRARLAWLYAGRDDALAIMARYADSGLLPAELHAFLSSTPVELLHVNHVFSMLLATRIARLVQRIQGRRPRILLDTHDVQSDALLARGKRNPMSRRHDSHVALLRTELALCARADALVHVTQADCDFFASHLPAKYHTVVLPTLDPATEAELVRRRGQSAGSRTGPRAGPDGGELVYIGNQHEANLATVRWLLTEVLPLTGPKETSREPLREPLDESSSVAGRIRIVGAIGGLVRRRDPELFERHAALFAGEVPSILDEYGRARAILAPAQTGTGTSIKLIEALCAGKPVLTTTLGLRGLPAGALAGPDIEVHDTAADFAAALDRWAGGPASAFSEANAALYDRVFSTGRYYAALEALITGTFEPISTQRAKSAGITP